MPEEPPYGPPIPPWVPPVDDDPPACKRVCVFPALTLEQIMEKFGVADVLSLAARSGANVDDFFWEVSNRLLEADGNEVSRKWFREYYPEHHFNFSTVAGRLSFSSGVFNRGFNAGIVGASAPLQREWGRPEDYADKQEVEEKPRYRPHWWMKKPEPEVNLPYCEWVCQDVDIRRGLEGAALRIGTVVFA